MTDEHPLSVFFSFETYRDGAVHIPSNLGIEMPIDSTDEYRQTKERARTRVDDAVSGNAEPLRRLNENRSGWSLNFFQEAGEASGSFHSSHPRAPILSRGTGTEKARSQEEASRRARGQIRRYCAHNRLNRLGTLTFKGEGWHDPLLMRTDLSVFFVELRKSQGSDLPYLWVPEWHTTNHGLHLRLCSRSLHQALGDRSCVASRLRVYQNSWRPSTWKPRSRSSADRCRLSLEACGQSPF